MPEKWSLWLKFLVIVTFTVVFVLGSAFISVEKQKDDEELEDIDNSFLREKGRSKDGPILESGPGTII